ncbi:MAG: protein kinase [Bacteroidales bacterium]|jgi:serine/threonine protein kinase|nr:protein kinase [Bacteroidales bacterium]
MNSNEGIITLAGHNYSVIKELEKGSFGTVMLIKDPITDKLFALKKYNDKWKDEDKKQEYYDRFLDEIKILFDLNHPNIVRIYSHHVDEESFTGYYVMEFIKGVTIEKFMQSYDASSKCVSLDNIFIQLIDAFQYMESSNVAHRDINGKNIMINEIGMVKIIDFGIGKVIKNEDDENCTLRPEIIRLTLPQEHHDGKYPLQSDIFHLAILLKRWLDLGPDIKVTDFSYHNVLSKMMEKKPENRYHSFTEIKKDINKLYFSSSENVSHSDIYNLLKRIKNYDGKSNITYLAQKFCDSFSIVLLSLAPTNGEGSYKQLLPQIEAAKPLRDLFYDYIEALIEIRSENVGTILGDFFEDIYNSPYHNFKEHNSYNKTAIEFSQFMVWEMFIGSTAILLHFRMYNALNELLCRTYDLIKWEIGPRRKANTFVQFRPMHQYIEELIKPKSETPDLYTLAGDIVTKRKKPLAITQQSLVDADMILFQLSRIYDFPENVNMSGYFHGWFPKLYIYGDIKQSLWSQMVSRRHCQNLFPLFGVTNLEQLKEMVKKSKLDEKVCYLGFSRPAAPIQQSIELNKIGTMP